MSHPYNFTPPVVTPSWTQALQQGLATTIAGIRQKRKDEEDQKQRDLDNKQRERQLTDLESGQELARVQAGLTPAIDAPPPPSHQDTPAPDAEATPLLPTVPTTAGAAQTAPGAGSSLASTLSDVRAKRRANESVSMDSWRDLAAGGAPMTEPSVSPQGDHLGAATSSGMPADTRTGEAPTARRVMVAGKAYDYVPPEQANAAFADRLALHRADLKRTQDLGDRERAIGDLVATGMNRGQAGAVVDNHANYSDINPVSLRPETIAETQRQEGVRLSQSLAEIRERNKGLIAEHAMSQRDLVTGSIDKLNDDAAKDVQIADTHLKNLTNNLDPRQQPTDPGHEAWASEVADARDMFSKAQKRHEYYQGVVDQRVQKVSGAAPAAELKQPTSGMIDNASRDPDYLDDLKKRGYDVSKIKPNPLRMPPGYLSGGH